MAELDELFRAVLQSPERNGPRRRYAKFLENQGDELGEYIRLAIDGDRNRLTTHADITRALELHNKLRQRQVAPLQPWIRSHNRDRGLVVLVEMDGRTFLDHANEVFAAAPIQHLDLVDTKAVFAKLVESPLLARVQTLKLQKNDLGDEEVALLASSPYVGHVKYLNLARNRIGEAGLHSLAASSKLAALKRLHIDHNLVESPVSKWSSDGVSGLVYSAGAGPMKAVLEKTYGPKAWLDPTEEDVNLDRSWLCDAGE